MELVPSPRREVRCCPRPWVKGKVAIVAHEPIVRRLHLPVLGRVVILPHVPVPAIVVPLASSDTLLEVEFGKGTDIAEAVNMDSELSEKVDDVVARLGEAVGY